MRGIIMDKAEILKKIKEAEIKVEEDTKAAEEWSKNAILEAKMEARKIIEEAENEAEKIKAEILENAKAQIEVEKEEIRKKKMKEVEEIAEKGKESLWKAVDFLYNEFVGMVEHA
jgi:V/A-type H+-transporting ATPase subunit G/H